MPLKSMRVEVWGHRLLLCLSVLSPGRRHRSPALCYAKGAVHGLLSRTRITGALPASPSYLPPKYSSASASPQDSGVPVASLHLTGKD